MREIPGVAVDLRQHAEVVRSVPLNRSMLKREEFFADKANLSFIILTVTAGHPSAAPRVVRHARRPVGEEEHRQSICRSRSSGVSGAVA